MGWWAVVDAGVTRSTDKPYIGAACFRFEDDGTDFVDLKSPEIPASGNETWTYSLYYRVDDGDWRRHTYTFTTTAGATWVRYHLFRKRDGPCFTLRIADSNGTITYSVIAEGGTYYYADALQAEKKSYPTPYLDGSLPGHSWSGTEHASTSSRPNSYIDWSSILDTIPTDGGTLAVWFAPALDLDGTYAGQGWHDFLMCRFAANENDESVWVRFNNDGRCNLHIRHQSATLASYYFTPVAYEFHLICFTWSKTSSEGCIYLDGELVASGSGFEGFPNAAQLFRLNEYCKSGCLFDDLFILDRPLSADEVRAVYESNAPVFAETSTWHWRTPNNLAWADSEGLWCIDSDGNATFGVSGVDGKSWGGMTVDAGDVLIGNASQQYVLWDASAGELKVAGEIIAESGSIDGLLNMGDGGEIRLGTGTPGTDFTGIRLW
ncbi:MAG TPA: hypothetical protein EYP04_12070 [Anaerolineae bacterium]|nr:hypothetical protein [Anaerolineae bacterium]